MDECIRNECVNDCFTYTFPGTFTYVDRTVWRCPCSLVKADSNAFSGRNQHSESGELFVLWRTRIICFPPEKKVNDSLLGSKNIVGKQFYLLICYLRNYDSSRQCFSVNLSIGSAHSKFSSLNQPGLVFGTHRKKNVGNASRQKKKKIMSYTLDCKIEALTTCQLSFPFFFFFLFQISVPHVFCTFHGYFNNRLPKVPKPRIEWMETADMTDGTGLGRSNHRIRHENVSPTRLICPFPSFFFFFCPLQKRLRSTPVQDYIASMYN